MKVLFVCSGNRVGINPIIKNQGDSLERLGVSVDYYTIIGKGVKGYLRNIFRLKKYLNQNKYDIIHSHYSLTSFVASLAGSKNLVVSLMGSDVKSSRYYKFLIGLFSKLFSWKTIIIKSHDMYDDLGIKRAVVIPNGVDFNRFTTLEKIECQLNLCWDISKLHILFTSNPDRPEKNYKLAFDAVESLGNKDVELHFMRGVNNAETPIWYNAADVVILTSLWEGSPNAIKEAMACNRPIVTTDVGDVRWLMGDTEGCYFTSYDADVCAEKLKQAIEFSRTNGATIGRERIINLELDSATVANKILDIYKLIINKK